MASFVDTNVLLYAVSTADDEAAKRSVAREILNRDDLVLSVQVLQEFYVQATRRAKPDRLAHEPATALIESWLRFRVVVTTVSLMQHALASALRWRISYWDAAIVEAARKRRLFNPALRGSAAGHELRRGDGGESLRGA